jgi:DNA-binding Xre family transcriptional regulator
VREAAARVKMNMRHWQKIESGEVNVTLQTLARLGAALGCDPADLIDAPPSVTPT